MELTTTPEQQANLDAEIAKRTERCANLISGKQPNKNVIELYSDEEVVRCYLETLTRDQLFEPRFDNGAAVETVVQMPEYQAFVDGLWNR